MHLFGKRGNSSNKWKAEYDDRLYKIYDWGGNLAGYMFPAYRDIEPKMKKKKMKKLLLSRIESTPKSDKEHFCFRWSS